jgi:iron complex transport system ATP-binding protein
MRTLDFQSPTLRRGTFQLAIGVIAPSPGRVTVLIGPNGGGKTTALRLAAGLLMPDTGSVLIDGEPVHALSAPQRAARIALVTQRPDVGAPFSVREVAALGRIARPTDGQRVERALQRVGLAALADRPYHSLSGGQQQRVAVARALAQHEPGGILLLDEAFAAVDPPEAAAIVRAVREEAAAGATVLAATHDMAVASAIADDVWCIVAGQTRAFGPASDLLTAAALPALLGVAIAEASGANGRIAVADYRAILPTQAP